MSEKDEEIMIEFRASSSMEMSKCRRCSEMGFKTLREMLTAYLLLDELDSLLDSGPARSYSSADFGGEFGEHGVCPGSEGDFAEHELKFYLIDPFLDDRLADEENSESDSESDSSSESEE